MRNTLPRETLNHVAEFGSSSTGSEPRDAIPPKPIAVSIGAGLPPVPLRLVNKIKSGEFVDMDEPLPNHLGCYKGHTQNDQPYTSKPIKHSTFNIIE